MAKTFAKLAYPNEDIIVYEAHIQIISLLPDTDQLKNKRINSDYNIGFSLADSIIYGNGVRVKGDVPLYMVKNRYNYKNN